MEGQFHPGNMIAVCIINHTPLEVWCSLTSEPQPPKSHKVLHAVQFLNTSPPNINFLMNSGGIHAKESDESDELSYKQNH